MFGVFGIGEADGQGNVTKLCALQDVGVRFCADGVIAIIGARERDFVKKIILPTGLFGRVGDVENVIQIRIFGRIVDEGELFRFAIADALFAVGAVR